MMGVAAGQYSCRGRIEEGGLMEAEDLGGVEEFAWCADISVVPASKSSSYNHAFILLLASHTNVEVLVMLLMSSCLQD